MGRGPHAGSRASSATAGNGVVAAWLFHLRGVDLAGRPIEVSDPRVDELRRLAATGGDDPRPLLGMRSVFGSLGDDPELVAQIGSALHALARSGLHAAVRACRSSAASVEVVAA